MIKAPIKWIIKNKSRLQKFGRQHRPLRTVEKPTNDGDFTMIIRKKKQFTVSTAFKEISTSKGTVFFSLLIKSITPVMSTTTSAKDSKERPISKKWRQLKCSQSLCWRLVVLASRTSGVFSSAGELFPVYSLAAISELWPASVAMFAWKKQHKVDKPTYILKIWKMIIETDINAVYISTYTRMSYDKDTVSTGTDLRK